VNEASTSRVGIRDLAGAAPNFGFVALFAWAWVSPSSLGDERVNWLFWTLVIEFLVVHSTGFMAAAVYSSQERASRFKAAAMFGFPYFVLTGIFALAMKAWWPLASFWSLTANRWLGPLIGKLEPEQTREFVMVSWVVSMAFYCLAVPLAMALPVPELGFAEHPVLLAGANSPEEAQLHRWMAAGAAYFTINGLSEALRHRWVPARVRRGIGRTTQINPRRPLL
jgi:hypothetical protein